MKDEGFFSRWSRRKAQTTRGESAEPESKADVESPADAQPRADDAASRTRAQAQAQTQAGPLVPQEQAAPPAPTLEDVARLTRESDYSRFVAKDVDDDIKRAAMRKLFSDPHFNKMDGLDVYIDDYTQSTPIPQAVLRQMVQSQFLGLFREEDGPSSDEHIGRSPEGMQAGLGQPGARLEETITAKQDKAATGAEPDGGDSAGVPASDAHQDIGPAQAAAPADSHDGNEDPDLQLQPDDAARRPGPGEGAGH